MNVVAERSIKIKYLSIHLKVNENTNIKIIYENLMKIIIRNETQIKYSNSYKYKGHSKRN